MLKQLSWLAAVVTALGASSARGDVIRTFSAAGFDSVNDSRITGTFVVDATTDQFTSASLIFAAPDSLTLVKIQSQGDVGLNYVMEIDDSGRDYARIILPVDGQSLSEYTGGSLGGSIYTPGSSDGDELDGDLTLTSTTTTPEPASFALLSVAQFALLKRPRRSGKA